MCTNMPYVYALFLLFIFMSSVCYTKRRKLINDFYVWFCQIATPILHKETELKPSYEETP